MVKVSQQLAPSQTSASRIKLQRYRKLHLHFFRKETKQAESKKTHVVKVVVLDGSRALNYILFSIKVSFTTHSSIHLFVSHSLSLSLSLSLHHAAVV